MYSEYFSFLVVALHSAKHKCTPPKLLFCTISVQCNAVVVIYDGDVEIRYTDAFVAFPI